MAEEGEVPQAKRGYDFDVVKKDQGADFECTICQLILHEPHSTPCHHAFCHVCLTQWHEELKRENRPMTCPICNTVYDPEKIHHEGVIDRMVKTSLDIKCKQNKIGCGWQGKIIDYQGHKLTCHYETVPCQNEGCLEMRLRKDLPKHQQSCEYRLTQCGYCELKKTVIEIKDHHQLCPMMKTVCSNVECEVQVLRKDIEEHLLKQCLYQNIECDYYDVGCHQMFKRREMRDHHKENFVEHQLMMLKDYKTTKQKLNETENDLQQEKKKNEQLEEKLKEANRRIDRMENNLKESQTECIKLHQNNFSLIDTLSFCIRSCFQTKDGSCQMLCGLGDIQISHLVKKQKKLLDKHDIEAVEVPFKFISRFRDDFIKDEQNGNLRLRIKGGYGEMIEACVTSMPMHKLCTTSNAKRKISFIKTNLGGGIHNHVKYIEKREFLKRSADKIEHKRFFNDNIIIIGDEDEYTSKFYLYKPHLSAKKAEICLIGSSSLLFNHELVYDDQDFNDYKIEYDQDETGFVNIFGGYGFLLIALYERD